MKLSGISLDRHPSLAQGNFSLDAFLREFTSLGPVREGDFPEIQDHFLQDSYRKQEEFSRTAQALVSRVPLHSQQQDYQRALSHLVHEYVVEGLSRTYAEISPELFSIERVIPHTVKAYSGSREVEITVPLFASVPFAGEENAWQLSKVGLYEDANERIDVKISSPVPPIPFAARDEAKGARKKHLDVLAACLDAPVLGDVALDQYASLVGDLQLTMHWIPRAEDLHIEERVIDKDPFLSANLYGRHFLVHQWDVEGELPFEHYLAEFSSKQK